jgi:hypothetical protein
MESADGRSAFGVDHGEIAKGLNPVPALRGMGQKAKAGMKLKAPDDPTRGTYNNLRLALTPQPGRVSAKKARGL